tara:strand:- start:136 stop:420 length:285 start_codon:yes stop_codon:yes gene_type:complete
MKRFLVTLLIALSLICFSGCGLMVDSSSIANAVSKQGYSDVRVHSKGVFFVSWRGCSKSDDAVFKVTAKNALNKQVNLIVCAGWPFKGVTIRTK